MSTRRDPQDAKAPFQKSDADAIAALYLAKKDMIDKGLITANENMCHVVHVDYRDSSGYGMCLDGYGIRRSRMHRSIFQAEGSEDLANHPQMVVGHMCENRACVNEEHLKLMTRSENCLLYTSPSPRDS